MTFLSIFILPTLLRIALFKGITIPLIYNRLSLPHQQEAIFSLLEYQLERTIYLIPSIEVKVGSHEQKINVFVSTLESKFYLADYSGETRSKAYHSNNEIFSLDNLSPGYKGKLAKDHFALGDITIKWFPFIHIVASELGYQYKGNLGLSYQYRIPDSTVNEDEQEYSILYQLRKNGHIEKHIIAVSITDHSSKLIIGDYPSELPNNPNQFNYKTCPLLQNDSNGKPNHLWQCMLDSIYFSDNALQVMRTPVAFSFGGNMLAVPEKLFNEIKEKYFQRALENKECKVSKGSFNKIYCSHYSNIQLKSLSLIFGKWTLRLETEDLFRFSQASNSYLFIVFFNRDVYVNKWILGINVLKNISPVFDGEQNQFGLIYKRKPSEIKRRIVLP